ncbi:MAG: hypothetical protein PHF84_01825 [bacterium]|nr:hypothetical protein [bacterium]
MINKKQRKSISDIDKRLRNLTLLNIFLIVSGVIWLDFLGLINIRGRIFPYLSRIPGLNYIMPNRTEDPFLLAQEEYKKQELSRKLEGDKLNELDSRLKGKELKLRDKETALLRMEDQLKQKEKALDKKYQDKETYKQKINQQAKYFVSMKPDEAVKRLQNMNDLLVIDILKEIEQQAVSQGKQSIVPYFFSLMDPAKSAVIQRKMTVVEEDPDNKTNE